MRYLKLFAIVLLLTPELLSQTPSGPLSKKMPQLRFRGSAVEALLCIGQTFQVPLGIISSDSLLTNTQVSLNGVDVGLPSALDSVLLSVTSYKWSAVNNVIMLEKKDTKLANTYLNIIVPDFEASSDTAEHLSAKLWMTIELQIDPKRGGFAGVLHPNAADKVLPSISLKNKHVYEILNWIVAENGSAAWIAKPWPADQIQDLGMYDLWNIVFYSPAETDH